MGRRNPCPSVVRTKVAITGSPSIHIWPNVSRGHSPIFSERHRHLLRFHANILTVDPVWCTRGRMTAINNINKNASTNKLFLVLMLLCLYAGMLNVALDQNPPSSETLSGSESPSTLDEMDGELEVDVESSSVGRSKEGLSRDPSDPQPQRNEVSLQNMRLHNRIMVIPEYKLLFCYIEKVGCSMFNQFFRLLRIYHPSVSPEERAWLAQSHFGRANPTHFNMTLKDLKVLINDDQWTKAVFFRDPADRFLSGFKSKCGGADSDGGRHCRLAFGETPNPKGGKPRPILDGSPVSFHHSIEIALNRTRKVFGNPHFKASAHFCGGLGQTIDHYSFVHKLEKQTVSKHLTTLMNHLGVDRNLTEGLLERAVKTGGMLNPIDVENVQQMYGLKLRGSISSNHHTEDHHLTAKDYFKSPDILEKLQSVYKMDYDMFQLEPPSLDEIK